MLSDLLQNERDEAALMFKGWADGLPIDPRPDLDPVAILNVTLVAASRELASGTSPGHSFTVTVPGAKRR